MTRIGMNPARNKNISYVPGRVTAAVMSHVPSLEGYFSGRLDVLKLSLESLMATVGNDTDIAVLNNGSCDEVSQYFDQLLQAGRIDILIHSKRNLGVVGGLKILFNAVLGELIAYCDDDVLYYPGWLQDHLKILDTYPDVGMVSGAPAGYSSEEAVRAVDTFVEEQQDAVQVREHKRVSAWEEGWAISTGRSVPAHLEQIKDTPHRLLTYRGVEAVQSAKHFQFLTPKKVICDGFDSAWSGKLMGGKKELDEAVDRMGYLRLCTVDRCTRHIGNALSPEIVGEARRLGYPVAAETPVYKAHQHWLLKIPGSGRILWPLYRWLFKILHNLK